MRPAKIAQSVSVSIMGSAIGSGLSLLGWGTFTETNMNQNEAIIEVSFVMLMITALMFVVYLIADWRLYAYPLPLAAPPVSKSDAGSFAFWEQIDKESR